MRNCGFLFLVCLSCAVGCNPTSDRQPSEATPPGEQASQPGIAGIITEPVEALMRVKKSTVLEIQIPHALNLFRATEGRWPRSHDEFMERIVTANKIQLPKLPEGYEYRFDPQSGELQVKAAEP